jgi:hypothetical protein
VRFVDEGLTTTDEIPVLSVIVAVPDTVSSATEVARTVSVEGFGRVAGQV